MHARRSLQARFLLTLVRALSPTNDALCTNFSNFFPCRSASKSQRTKDVFVPLRQRQLNFPKSQFVAFVRLIDD